MIALTLLAALILPQDCPSGIPDQHLSEPVFYVGSHLIAQDQWYLMPDTEPITDAVCPVCGPVEAWVLSDQSQNDPAPWTWVDGYWEYRSAARREAVFLCPCGHLWRERWDGGPNLGGTWRFYGEGA